LDNGNERKNVEAEAEEVFFNDPLFVMEDVQHGHSEQRFHALGRTDLDRFLHITFTLRQQGTKIRVISARDMHRKELARYDQGR
jgi:uncharacterized protein